MKTRVASPYLHALTLERLERPRTVFCAGAGAVHGRVDEEAVGGGDLITLPVAVSTAADHHWNTGRRISFM